MQLHWLFLSLYNRTQSGCDRMSFTHSVAAFFAFLWDTGPYLMDRVLPYYGGNCGFCVICSDYSYMSSSNIYYRAYLL